MSPEAKEEAAVGDAEATQRAKTLQELLSKEVPKIAFAKSLGFLEERWMVGFSMFFFGCGFDSERIEIPLIFRGSWSMVETRWEEPRLLQLFEERRQRYDLDFGRLRELKPRGAWWRSRCRSGEKGR